MQVSFSTYENHEMKRNDLEANDQITKKSIVAHYNELLKYKKGYFIYATTEFECKGCDEEVYFLNLRRQ